jgi:hypothetical protein
VKPGTRPRLLLEAHNIASRHVRAERLVRRGDDLRDGHLGIANRRLIGNDLRVVLEFAFDDLVEDAGGFPEFSIWAR